VTHTESSLTQKLGGLQKAGPISFARVVVWYFLILFWLLFSVLSRLSNPGFSGFEGWAIGLLILLASGLIQVRLRQWLYRLRWFGLLLGCLAVTLFEPTQSLGSGKAFVPRLVWWLVISGVAATACRLLYGVFVLPYVEASESSIDEKVFRNVFHKRTKIAILVTTAFIVLEIFSRTWVGFYKIFNLTINPDLRIYVRMDKHISKLAPAAQSFIFPNDPRLPGHEGIANQIFVEGVIGPNVLGVDSQTRIHLVTNSLGFKSPEPIMPKPGGEYRILCIGGSTTEQGLSNEATYPALVERYLSESGYRNVRAYNFGLASYSSRDSLLRFREYLTYEPDLILVMHGVNEVKYVSLAPKLDPTVFGSKLLA